MLIPSFYFSSAAGKMKVLATVLVAAFMVIILIAVSFEPLGGIGTVSFNLTASSPFCPEKPIEKDYSPSAIRSRIQAAQTKARSLFKAQSTTPEEAITEYQRRYHRDPPPGFSDWVQSALDHNSTVIDDFDQIDRDLKPYRTLDAQRAAQLLNKKKKNWPHTRRIIIQNGTMNTLDSYIYKPYWEHMMEPFVHSMPNNSLFYVSTIDEPRILRKSGSQPDQIKFTERPGRSIEDLIQDSCAQRPCEQALEMSSENDVCRSSDPGKLHGVVSSPDTFSYTYSPVPLLSYGRMSAFYDILMPCPCYFGHPLLDSDQVPFLDKKQLLYWRGTSTGAKALRHIWQYGHRQRFVSFVHSLQNAAKLLEMSSYFGTKVNHLDKNRIALFKDVFNVQIAAYGQCEHEGDRTVCQDMEQALGPGNYDPEDTSLKYRYLFDLDGNSMSTRFYRLLSQQAVVLKQTWFQEWHDDRLIPWAHYIPVTLGMEELPSLMDFLINSREGERLSANIAQAGYDWSRLVLREIDMSLYVYRLLLELAEIYGPVDPLEMGIKE